MATKVFISWSGERSKLLATALRDLLPDANQDLETWMSEHDIAAGARWGPELTTQLADCRIGIVCLTPENVTAPWLLFEAGALAKSISESRVVPYRLNLSAADVPFPLAQFQGVDCDEAGTRKLLAGLNTVREAAMSEDRLDRIFERWWPDLSARIKGIPGPSTPPAKQWDDRALLEEILQLLRREQKPLPAQRLADDSWEEGGRTDAVSSFKDLMVRLVELVRSTEADDTIRYLAYTPAIGFLTETPELFAELEQCLWDKADSIDMICLNDDDLKRWHNCFKGKAISRSNGHIAASLIQEANEVSATLLEHLRDEGRTPIRKTFMELPGFYLFKNSKRALIAHPVGVPLLHGADPPSLGNELKASKVDMFGLDTNLPQIVMIAGLTFAGVR